MFLKNVLILHSDEKDLSAVAEVTGNVKYILTALFTSLNKFVETNKNLKRE